MNIKWKKMSRHAARKDLIADSSDVGPTIHCLAFHHPNMTPVPQILQVADKPTPTSLFQPSPIARKENKKTNWNMSPPEVDNSCHLLIYIVANMTGIDVFICFVYLSVFCFISANSTKTQQSAPRRYPWVHKV